MSGQRQHIDFFRKVLLRRQLLPVQGAAYVPFIGNGDIAAELYGNLQIYGADINPALVATAQSRLPGASILVADCDRWPFPGCPVSFSLADFDSFSFPYASLRAFWASAQLAPSVVIYGTDAQRQAILRTGRWRNPNGEKQLAATLVERRAVYNFYWLRVVRPWLKATLAPYAIIQERFYLRRNMLYWGIVCELPNPPKQRKA